jgi:hypothetical protein
MRSAKRYAFRLTSKALLRRPAPSKGAHRGCSPQCAEPLLGRCEDDRLRGSAESRRRIEADFSCAQVDLLRGPRSSDQSILTDAQCLLGGLNGAGKES